VHVVANNHVVIGTYVHESCGTEKEGCMQGSSPDVTMVGSAMTLRRTATRKINRPLARLATS
jgi:hypothetical protein